MAKLSFLSLLLCIVSYGCFAQQSGGQCQIQSINPQEPSFQVKAEAGISEIWDSSNQQFQCAGVGLIRHVIQPGGFLMPSYTSSPLLCYVQEGRGFLGLVVPGCPETFQSSQVQIDRRRRFFDKHQKIQNFRQGDMIALPAATAHWLYNNGDQPLVVIVLEDSTNNINQLDPAPRRFFLAGKPQGQQQQGQQGPEGWYGGGLLASDNVFEGIPEETMAEALNVDIEIARLLKSGKHDQRGHIIRVENLQVLTPPITQGQQDQNGMEETICTARVRQNIDNPSRADVYNPRGGRFTTVNSLTFPILSYLQLSAERGVLYDNAIMSPHWYLNAHRVVYVTRGEGRVQIVNDKGQQVFDGQLGRGQVVVVPMGYAVVKRAGKGGFEWVGFNTNDNAMMNTVVGRTSAFAGMPASVISLSYQISQEQAMKLKSSRQETIILSPTSEE